MTRTRTTLLGMLALVSSVPGCGVSRSEFDSKAQEAANATLQADAAKKQVEQLKQQLASDDEQIGQLKGSLGLAEAQAITDNQKSALEEGKRAVQEAQERGKLLDDLQSKFKKMIDAGRLKLTTRHGRIVLELHNDILFDTGAAELKADGKLAVSEVAATLRGVGARRFQVAGHTDSEPITAETKKKYPTNWELSTARAIAVVKLLVTDGVEPSTLSAAGYGPYDAVASNATPDGQLRNRRIEITLVPNVTQLVVPGAADKGDAKK